MLNGIVHPLKDGLRALVDGRHALLYREQEQDHRQAHGGTISFRQILREGFPLRIPDQPYPKVWLAELPQS